MQFGWHPKHLIPLFYNKGRIELLPENWTIVGNVFHFYDKVSVVSIDLKEPLKAGDKVGVLLEDRYVEELPTELQVNKQVVSLASAGERVAYKTTLARNELKVGQPVYLVSSQ